MSDGPPEGFAPHFRKSPVTDPWEPLFSRRLESMVQIGLTVRPAHCNSRGLPHGSVIATLADSAMALSCGTTLPPTRELVTVGLSIDTIGTARLGQWLQVEPRVLQLASSMTFADALITADGAVVARASGSFRVTG